MKLTETVVLYLQWNLVAVRGVTVCDSMSYRGTVFLTPLKGNLNKDGYLDILSNFAIPSAHLLGYGYYFIFLDDGATCHRDNIIKPWKSERNMRCLEWPPQSPDLNPIENLWRDLGEAIRNTRCHNLNELQQTLVNKVYGPLVHWKLKHCNISVDWTQHEP